MLRIRSLLLLLLVAAIVLAPTERAVAAPASPDTGFLVTSRGETGYVALGVFAQPPGATTAFSERVGDTLVPLATVPVDARGFAPLERAVTWRCDRLVRSFVATVTPPSGTPRTADADIRTPSCASRVLLKAPRHVDRRGLLVVRVVDAWGLGDRTVRLCVSGARLGHGCRELPLSPDAAGVMRRFRPRGDGQVRVLATLDGHRTQTRVAVGTARPVAVRTGPVLLTTGDSTIEGIDSVLDDDFGALARVRTESAPGTRLSGDGESSWLARARSQVRRLRPRLTVLSLGANESFGNTLPDGRTVNCCGPEWTDELAARQRRLIDIYRRGGRGKVVWMLLPAPSSAAKAETIDAANRAVLQATTGVPGAYVVDLRPIFSPDGRFHASIDRDGRPVVVRASDGVHLSAAGQAIAADAVRALISREGLLDRA
ncbi:MAG: hypothetical protein JWM31_2190 [Solirubrobacterales bacterium]|nr:hypothetical protein [Solirubrobacterales bacterium]